MQEFDAFNLLTQANGATILEVSSCRKGCNAYSILASEKGVWVSEEGLPQSLLIDISYLKHHPDIKYFGWYCWHNYTSNPSIVELLVTSDYQSYKRWCTFQSVLSSKPQIFNIDTLGKSIKAIKVLIRDTYGASNTYLNKIYLLEKLPKSLKKNKTIDESIVNISEISSHYDPDTFPKNPKSKLKFQLEDLQDTVENMRIKYDKPDEISELEGEIQSWQGKMDEINQSLRVLSGKISRVETNARSLKDNRMIDEFKKEIVEEIKRKRKKKTKERKFERDTQKQVFAVDSRAGEIISLIQTKTEEKLKKIRQLQLDRLHKN